jgi:hypothetical protein
MVAFSRPARFANPYALLGLPPGSPLADVKRAYRRLAMRVHPDHAGTASLQAFLAVRAAYEWIRTRRPLAEARNRPPSSDHQPVPWPGSWPGGRWYWEGFHGRSVGRSQDTCVSMTVAGTDLPGIEPHPTRQ